MLSLKSHASINYGTPINFDNWSLSDNNLALVSDPLPSRTEAEKVLAEFQKAYPGINFSLMAAFPITETLICIKRPDITLSAYRTYPDLARRVETLWGDRFITPDPRVSIKEDIEGYNSRIILLSEADLINKLQKRFDEAQLSLGQERLPGWDRAIEDDDETSFSSDSYASYDECSSEDFDITRQTITNCLAVGRAGTHTRNLEVGTASTIGRRRYNEDRLVAGQFVHNTNVIPYFAVFDGHSGDTTANFLKAILADFLPMILTLPVEQDNHFVKNTLIYSGLKLFFLNLSKALKEHCPENRSGSTALLAMIIDNALWVVNIGDSRAILSCDSKVTALSIDHDLQSEKECRSVWKRGQNVFVTDNEGMRRVCNLNMSRAVGHDELNSGINPRGQIIRAELDSLEDGRNFLILASDGLFDAGTSEQVAERVDLFASNQSTCEDIAHELVQNALDAGSPDNISTFVIKL